MTDTPAPHLQRFRQDPKRRNLTVRSVTQLTPAMIRVVLAGDDLADFQSLAPDDHVKLFLGPDTAEARPQMRDYTPRRFDPVRRELTLDFVDHPGGPAADWARAAQPGDVARIGGPRGSTVITGPVTHWLLIGDETALPAIGRWIEELPAGTPVTSLVAVPSEADRQGFESVARHEAHWIARPLAKAADPGPLLAALSGIELRPGTFAWIAAEAGVAKALRAALIARGMAPNWIKASGYWVQGQADASVKSLDD
ncbi:siderophore-interacting protein [Pseudogemmobacter blasticus]|uniref:NADPH-dependent ferric siderophore reductase n=1 Tax=Fuscovulum blasticum DSM 2131 TaxID=1188250 RepID=A0A2T4JE09_FUSBL|nr:siderophore-interacting protein [Fuscovulum blasticum]PTE16131.1 NADPH-dependent ferric siderophore reductase [Fuscovulum blasticum DSM 2131]